MLDKLFESVSGELIQNVTEKTGISMDQAKQMLPIAQESVGAGLLEQVQGGNLDGIMGMLNSGSGMSDNPIFAAIQGKLLSGVMTKLGLPEQVASLASTIGLESIFGQLTAMLTNDEGNVEASGLMDMIGGGDAMDIAKKIAGDKLGDALGGALGGLFK